MVSFYLSFITRFFLFCYPCDSFSLFLAELIASFLFIIPPIPNSLHFLFSTRVTPFPPLYLLVLLILFYFSFLLLTVILNSEQLLPASQQRRFSFHYHHQNSEIDL